MELFIAEKPSLAQAIVHGLGGGERKDGFFQCGEKIVTYCFGHILENFSPEDYDEKYKAWSLTTLPISPSPWKLKVKKDCRKQFGIIKKLLKEANMIINAGDPDREGQLLVDEVLDYCGVFKEKKIVKRILLNALDDKSVQYALHHLEDNQKFLGLRNSALARSRADWYLGMNMTRFFSIKANQAGYRGVVSVGRVQTPTIALIVRREEEIKNFRPVTYYQLRVLWKHMNGSFYATWKPKENCPHLDSEGRLLDVTVLKKLSAYIDGQPGKISFIEQKKGESQPRLPYSLSSLQIEAGKKYGYSPQQVLDAQQSLYEKKLTSYPRSDCEYLPENQFVDGSTILWHLKNISKEFSGLIEDSDSNLKSRCWNDKKISAHHAIIPTTVAADLSSLTEVEKNLYVLVAKAYIAQFYPNQQFLTTKIEVLCAGETFSTSGKIILKEGWQKIYHGEQEENEGKDENTKLPSIEKGDDVSQGTHEILEKVTKPPKRFTSSTLVQAMKEIGKYVKDKTLKPILKNCSGIGTEATRAGIIETLQKREYATLVKKELHPTEKAYMLVNVLPESFTYPDVTAQWETALEAISKNEMEYFTFAEKQKSFIQQLFQDAAMVQIASPTNVIKCPKCSKPLVRRKSAKGFFWGCSGYPDCKTIFSDQKGKPVLSHK